MKKTTKQNRERILYRVRELRVEEKRGNIPYIVMWVSAGGFIALEHHGTLTGAINHEQHLKSIGRQPSVLVCLEQCEIGEAHDA